MKLFLFMLMFSFTTSFIGIIYNKKFMLSMILCMESILLKLLMFKFLLSMFSKQSPLNSFSIFILTLSAMEASMGMSLLTLTSRTLNTKKMNTLKTLKT